MPNLPHSPALPHLPHLPYIAAYPEPLRAQAASLLADGRLAGVLRGRYPRAHDIRSDKALYGYVQAIKGELLRSAEPVSKVAFDSKIQPVQHALGLHTAISRVQGNKLKAKHEIRIATVFRAAPPEFLRMIAVHELAHLKEKQHDKAFYKLCCAMEPQYHQYEFDLRLYLTLLDHGGAQLWDSNVYAMKQS
jgi:predicted metal-dependent hydrolase